MKEVHFEYSLADIQKCRTLMAQSISVGVLLRDKLNFVSGSNRAIANLAFDRRRFFLASWVNKLFWKQFLSTSTLKKTGNRWNWKSELEKNPTQREVTKAMYFAANKVKRADSRKT